MEAIYFLLIVFGATYGIFTFASIMTQMPKYKYYKPTYEAIKSDTYVFASQSDSYVTFRPLDKKDEWWSDDEILFFYDKWSKKKESIKLLGNRNYIHEGLSNMFDPYSAYWFYKLHSLAKTKMAAPNIEAAETVKDKSKL
jgi:hypothetical protein